MNIGKTALACALVAMLARAAAADPGAIGSTSALPVLPGTAPQPVTGQPALPKPLAKPQKNPVPPDPYGNWQVNYNASQPAACAAPTDQSACVPAYAPTQQPAYVGPAPQSTGAASPSANGGNDNGYGVKASRVGFFGPEVVAPQPSSGGFVPPQPPAPVDAGPTCAAEAECPAACGDNHKYGPDFSDCGFFGRFLQAEIDEFRLGYPILDPKWRAEQEAQDVSELQTYNSFGGAALDPPRRAPPSPWVSPPFPGSEYQGYPLIGVPYNDSVYPLMKAIYGANTPFSETLKQSRIKFEGWATAFGSWSAAKQANTPTAYWITPNSIQLDQLIIKAERLPDEVQQDHIDWGFRSIGLYGIDYRYTTAGGWLSNQLLVHNQLYGFDPVEQYLQFYIPGFLDGTDIRVGRWIACPDIETQYSVDNYLGSHSILFTYDTYTQTGIMLTQKVSPRWSLQAVLHSGTDMAPWYPGAIPTGAFGGRWVSQSNNDAFYTWANALNNAQFRRFDVDGQPAGHDNFNYVVTTWEHRFNRSIHTKTESYYMWEYNAEVGGTPSIGPVQSFGGGGGNGALIPGLSRAYGVLNYTMFALSKMDYFTVRNEWYKDETGFRTGYASNYSSHTIGISHKFNDVLMLRPEIGYYRSYNTPAFDNGTQKGLWIAGADLTIRW
jgi:hypothetical protein